ncbi:MAG: hypothetical protein U0840_31185 [Gemmataceae bacterium]
MAKKTSRTQAPVHGEPQDDLKARIQWLLRERWGDSRAAMARDIGVSVTGLVNVVTGPQQPGRRLLTAILENSDVNPSWLLTGQGRPFLSSALPVAQQVLPGAPQEHPDHLLRDEQVEQMDDLYSRSRYWLRVSGREPVVRDKNQKILAGDLLLMETDRKCYPRTHRLDGRLCVVRVPGTQPPEYKLAELTYQAEDGEGAPERLEADTFDLGALVIERTIIDRMPDGEYQVSRRQMRQLEAKGPDQRPRFVPYHLEDMDFLSLRVRLSDIVAVCILMVRL